MLANEQKCTLRKAQLGRKTFTVCPAGQHSHPDYNGGKCHSFSQSHSITQNYDMSSPNAATALNIRNDILTITQTLNNDPYIKQLFIYINEVLRKPDDVQTWGKFYATLKVACKKNPKRQDLINILNKTAMVKL